MITFYPRNLGIWVKDFDFHPDITLTPKEKTNYKAFRNRAEFIQFLKDSGVRLDNPEFPLEIKQANERVYEKGHPGQGELFVVIQWTVIGWIRDDYK